MAGWRQKYLRALHAKMGVLERLPFLQAGVSDPASIKDKMRKTDLVAMNMDPCFKNGEPPVTACGETDFNSLSCNRAF